MGQSDPVLEDEVKYRYYTIIQLYRRATLQDNAQRYCFLQAIAFFISACKSTARLSHMENFPLFCTLGCFLQSTLESIEKYFHLILWAAGRLAEALFICFIMALL